MLVFRGNHQVAQMITPDFSQKLAKEIRKEVKILTDLSWDVQVKVTDCELVIRVRKEDCDKDLKVIYTQDTLDLDKYLVTRHEKAKKGYYEQSTALLRQEYCRASEMLEDALKYFLYSM